MVQKPTGVEYAVRFGCGTLFGFVIVLLLAIRLTELDWPVSLTISIIGALACGTLAMLGGDEFWDTIVRWLRWW